MLNLKDLKLNDFIKIAITVAITAALTFNIQVTITNNNYNQLSSDVKDVKDDVKNVQQEVKTVKNDTQILKQNVTTSIGIQNEILDEVN